MKISKKIQRFICLLLCVAFIVSTMPLGIFSVNAEVPDSTIQIGKTEIAHLTEVPEGYTPIYTKADLDAVRNNLSDKYILMNDIVFTEEDFAEGGDFYNDGSGWEPIGSSSTVAFEGIFDGNGYAIKNIYINKKDYYGCYAGLFAYVTNGTIKNLGISGGQIKADVYTTGSSMAGGIVARANNSTITNCYNTAAIQAHWVGGIVGIMSDGTVTNCYNSGVVYGYSGRGDYSYAGGILGGVYSGATVMNCYNTGAVTASTGYVADYGKISWAYAGGIAGTSDAGCDIAQCYNTANISAISRGDAGYCDILSAAGGIVGWKFGKIDDCYNTGSISAEGSEYAYAGGIAGEGTDGIEIKNCYNVGDVLAKSTNTHLYYAWDNPIEGYSELHKGSEIINCYYLGSEYPASSSTTRCTEEQMQLQSTFIGFDFDSVWYINLYGDFKYPQLYFEVIGTTVGDDVVKAETAGVNGKKSVFIATNVSEADVPGKKLIKASYTITLKDGKKATGERLIKMAYSFITLGNTVLTADDFAGADANDYVTGILFKNVPEGATVEVVFTIAE